MSETEGVQPAPPLPAYDIVDVPVVKTIPVPPETLASPGKRLGGLLLEILLAIVTLGIGYLIWSIIVWQQSTTPAKKILGMKVVSSKTGQDLTRGGMAMRQIVWQLVITIGSNITFGILFLVDAFMVFSGSRQRLLDRMASTLVINVPK